MRKRLVVYGMLALAIAITLSVERGAYRVNDTTEILIVANPINPLNPVVRNPYQEEYEQMLYPTVRITAGLATGSGVIIATTDEHRYTQIITAAHVVGDETTVHIELYNSEVITGTVVITDTVKDLALIRTQINPAPASRGWVNADLTDLQDKIFYAKLAPQTYPYFLFTPVYAIGCSLGLDPRPSQGIITSINLRTEGLRKSASHIEISAPILPGNSGGPVYDARTYEVIGIAVWVKVYDGQLITTMAGIVPINEIYNFLTSHQDIHPVRKFKAKGKSNRLSDNLITGLSNGAGTPRIKSGFPLSRE